MHGIGSEQELAQWLQRPVALVLWGGAHCGVCQALKPRLQEMVANGFPEVALASVDCAALPAACAQQGVFTLPVLRFFIAGKLVLEYGRSFGLAQVGEEMRAALARMG
ncbi:thioredoxin family protein [Comamonas composti]|uniref:thioredoxin family protein n=1 Tax=Comamonas composti TaxID=408558 RepID=UPI00047C7BEB|nr:thioredoxin family protein [Comamonas composti]